MNPKTNYLRAVFNFYSMRCPSCGKEMEEGWRYCPRCGYRKREGFFDSVFSRFRREMQEMDKMPKMMEKEFESFDVSDMLRRPGGRGFTIKITSGTGMEPKVEVRTTGDVNKKELEKQLEGMGVPVQHIQRQKPEQIRKQEKPMMMPEKTEEPETRVRRVDGRVLVEMLLPGVEERDIRIEEFENSIEVRAVGRGRAFFKIVTKPGNSSVLKREFKGGTLTLEVG